MWLYHVPFTICVVSVLRIAFCDKKRAFEIQTLMHFYIMITSLRLIFLFHNLLVFAISIKSRRRQLSVHILRINNICTKRGRQICQYCQFLWIYYSFSSSSIEKFPPLSGEPNSSTDVLDCPFGFIAN
jgi:hypothetical protein